MTIESTDACLGDEQLQRLADDVLLPPEISDIEWHVSQCSRCRELLESRSIDQTWQREFVTVLHRESDEVFEQDAIDDRPDDEELNGTILNLLGPTDDPQMLGRIADYEVVGVIGRGGMGVVFKAFDGALNRYVAIKMLLPHLAASGAARKRFEREGQAAAAVVDDHVLPIFAVSQWQGIPYLVTQYLRGGTLQKRIYESGPLDLREVLRIGLQTSRGLAAAHAQGLVHRDVKPANILLDGSVDRTMLTDFGLARAVDDASITRTGMITGTPQYMSPEQARGKSVDARSDLFGLGCVLYAMCTGRPPFRADSSYAILRLITDEEPCPIREINPEIPEWLASIIGKLMSKHPEDRYASADEVADVLESYLAHVQQPTAHPIPASHVAVTQSDRSRHYPPIIRWAIAAAFAFSLVVAGVLIVLELNKGTLTIESEADNVPIRIIQGDEVVEKLTVSQSGTSTRVASGDYVVEIEGEVSGISVVDGVVSLRRGATETVRIATNTRQEPPGNDQSLSEKETASVEASSEPPVQTIDSDDDGHARPDDPLSSLIARLREQKNLVGLGAMVMVDRELKSVATSGERKVGSGVPLQTDDLWHLGGITKSITATMIARLVESKQMQWTDTVGKVFPDPNVHPDWKPVTLEQLLTDCAGAPANFPSNVWLQRPKVGPESSQARRDAVLDVMADKPSRRPGEKFEYSNVGIAMAAAMAEEVTGMTWENLVRREVFEPLNLVTAGFGPPKSSDITLAQPRGHLTKFGGKFAMDDDVDNTPIMGPSGSVHMTLHELCLYATEHVFGDLGEGKLLSADTYKKLHTPMCEPYAFGLIKNAPSPQVPYTMYWHNGSNTMWYALVAFIPQTKTVIAVTSNDGDIDAAESAAWKILADNAVPIEVRPSSSFAKKSPFTAIRWQTVEPEVRLGEEWFKLKSINGLSTAEITSFSRRIYGDLWKKRFAEDLIELLSRMGHPPKDTVALVVESLDSGATSVRENVPMTEANRRAIWTAARDRDE